MVILPLVMLVLQECLFDVSFDGLARDEPSRIGLILFADVLLAVAQVLFGYLKLDVVVHCLSLHCQIYLPLPASVRPAMPVVFGGLVSALP